MSINTVCREKNNWNNVPSDFRIDLYSANRMKEKYRANEYEYNVNVLKGFRSLVPFSQSNTKFKRPS